MAEHRQKQSSSRWQSLSRDGLIRTARLLPTDQDLADVQRQFEHPLPEAWESLVLACGQVSGFGRALLGLRARSRDDVDREDALDVLVLLRLTEPTFPRDLLPLEVLPDRQLQCVVVAADRSSWVVLIDLDRPELRHDAGVELADFVFEWRADLHGMSSVVSEIDGRTDSDASTLLRPDEWSTRRLCSQNVIVALLQTRHNRDSNERDVAVFAVAHLSAFAPGAPVRWALTTILTESYQAGGSLAVNFVRRSRARAGGRGYDRQRTEARGQRIPGPIMRWAKSHGVQLKFGSTGWDHQTGERLLLAATLLPDSLRRLLPTTTVPAATVCTAVATAAWPALDTEIVLRWAEDPVRILTGVVRQDDRVRYLADQHLLRTGLILSSLDRHLRKIDQESASDEDDTTRSLVVDVMDTQHVSVDVTSTVVTFTSSDGTPLSIGWPVLSGSFTPAPAVRVSVLALQTDLLAMVGSDYLSAIGPFDALIVPADALARRHELTQFVSTALKLDTCVLAAPDYTTTMDVAIAARLDQARMSRR